VLAGSALSACASGDPPLAAEYGRIDRPGVVLDNPAPAPTTPSPAEPAEPAEITLAFAGDVHFEDDVRERLADPATTLDTVSDVLSAADVTVVNLETAVTERGVAQPKTYTFRVGPEAFDALAASGVDVVTMANNHGADYGAEGVADTLAAAADAPLAVIGIGADDDAAFAPAMFEIGGTAVAVIGATDVPDHTAAAWSAGSGTPGVASARDRDRLLRAVAETADVADVVAVYLHYGTERINCPTPDQVSLATALANAGADIVVGAHAHVLLGAGWLGRTYVSYGLGNFVWYHPNSVAEATSGVLTLTVRDGNVVEHELTPTFTEQDGRPRVVEGETADEAIAAWDELRACTGLESGVEMG
jgi:poly-gamma-glutamate synthesis protein (capsule biosynthesis protein)